MNIQATDQAWLDTLRADFLRSGGRVTICPAFKPAQRPRRSDRIDPETKLRRQPRLSKPVIAEPADPVPDWSEKEARIVADLYVLAAAGYSKIAAAEALGITGKMVRTRAVRHNIPFNPGQLAKDADLLPQLRELARQGVSQKTAIATLRIGYRRLYRLLKAHNIKLRE